MHTYSLGNSNKINILDFNCQGKLVNATEVKLNLFNYILKLVVVDTNLTVDLATHFLHLTQAKFLVFWEVTTLSVFPKRLKEISGELGSRSRRLGC